MTGQDRKHLTRTPYSYTYSYTLLVHLLVHLLVYLLVHLLIHANILGIIRGTGIHPDPQILRKTHFL